MLHKPVKYCVHLCTVGSIAYGFGLETSFNIGLSFTWCYISLSTMPLCTTLAAVL